MIYTGYYGGLGVIDNDTVTVQVSNSAPINVDIRFEKAIPDWAFIVKPYKDGEIDQQEYIRRYTDQLDKYRENILGVIEYFKSTLKDYILLCYETPDKFCHRHILAKYINDALGAGLVKEYHVKPSNNATALF